MALFGNEARAPFAALLVWRHIRKELAVGLSGITVQPATVVLKRERIKIVPIRTCRICHRGCLEPEAHTARQMWCTSPVARLRIAWRACCWFLFIVKKEPWH